MNIYQLKFLQFSGSAEFQTTILLAGKPASHCTICSTLFQAIIDRLSLLRDNVLTSSELEVLRKHLSLQPSVLYTDWQEVWSRERQSLINSNIALKQLLSQAYEVVSEVSAMRLVTVDSSIL